MKKNYKIILLLMVSLGFINTIFSQTVIDYTVWSTSQCNAFNPPATVNGIVG